jgi:glycosyltransferase involved in cell wall biosynthesis
MSESMLSNSADTWPTISIITPCLNRAGMIEQAIASVQSQNYPKVEHIIVDGGSTDGTLRILENYPKLRVISEPDQGIYDALNKGIEMAGGEIIGHLNSDDLYESGALRSIGEAFKGHPEADIVCGGAIVFSDAVGGRCETVTEHNEPENKNLSLPSVMLGIPIINARFFRKRTYEGIGAYDTRYSIAADRELLIRAALTKMICVPLDRVVYRYRQHPGSLTISGHLFNMLPAAKEYMEIAEEYLSRKDISRQLRGYLRLWHTRSAALALVLELFSGEVRDSARTFARGWRRDALWPLRFVTIVARRLTRTRTENRRARLLTER